MSDQVVFLLVLVAFAVFLANAFDPFTGYALLWCELLAVLAGVSAFLLLRDDAGDAAAAAAKGMAPASSRRRAELSAEEEAFNAKLTVPWAWQTDGRRRCSASRRRSRSG